MSTRRAALAVMVAGAVTVLAGCGVSHNDADVAFARQMVPHHEQAVDMARLAADNASDPAVKRLAARIEKAQAPEIRVLEGWLSDWDAGHDGHGGHGAGGAGHSMDAMMSESDLRALEQARGPQFDRLFLTQMIAHHEGAIEMARTEQDDGKDDKAVALAEDIEAAQTDEIAQMRELLS